MLVILTRPQRPLSVSTARRESHGTREIRVGRWSVPRTWCNVGVLCGQFTAGMSRFRRTKTAQRAEKRKTAKQAQATTTDYEGEDEEIDKDESGVDKSLTINRTQHIPLHPREVRRPGLATYPESHVPGLAEEE